MSGLFACIIFMFSLAIYIANEFFHLNLFQGEAYLLIISLLPLIGIIFGIWAKGIWHFIGVLGNLAVFILATLIPLYRIFI
ncbi:MAG: hypothetical protein KBT36_14470 [Kurthia sp.]|nr:hypothetical protein [Candidatus Kurthia equi]